MMARSKRSLNDGEVELQVPEDVAVLDDESTQLLVEDVLKEEVVVLSEVVVKEEAVIPSNVGVIEESIVVNRREPVCINGVTLQHGENTIVGLARLSETPRFKALVKQGHIFVK